MRALQSLRSILIHRLPQAQHVTSASLVYPTSYLRAFAAAPCNEDLNRQFVGLRSMNRLHLAMGAAFVTGVLYQAVSQSSLCEQQASSGQTQVALSEPLHCILLLLIRSVYCFVFPSRKYTYPNATCSVLKGETNQSSLRKRWLSTPQRQLEFG